MAAELLDPETVKIINKLGYNFFSALVAIFAFFGLTGKKVLAFVEKAVAHDIKQDIEQKYETKIERILEEHKTEIQKLEEEIDKLKEKTEKLKRQIIRQEKPYYITIEETEEKGKSDGKHS